MKLMTLEELVSHDVVEFCFSIRYPEHWNFDSVFVDDDEFGCLSPYLNQVIPDFQYCAPQKITMEQWEQIQRLALETDEYQEFFKKISEWKIRDPGNSKFFWIYGV